jgi:Tol biopolymer transport system component
MSDSVSRCPRIRPARVWLVFLVAVAVIAAGAIAASQLLRTTAKTVRLDISPSSVILTNPGETRDLVARTTDDAGAGAPVGETVTWTSSHPEVVAVDGSGRLTAMGIGSSQVLAQAGGMKAPPVLVVVATLGAGVTAVPDSAIIGNLTESTPGAAPSVSNTYVVQLAGMTPGVGDLLLGTGGKALAGEVVAIEPSGADQRVTMRLVPLERLLPGVRIEEVFDLSRAVVSIPENVARLYDVVRTGDTYAFTPKANFTELVGASRPDHRSLAGLGGVAAIGNGPLTAAVSGTSALPPFTECETELSEFPIELAGPPAFSFELAPSLDVLWTPDNRLERFIVRATPKFTLAAALKVTAAFEAKLECVMQLFVFQVPVGGALSMFIGGLVPVSAGFEIGGKVTVATLSLGASATASTTMEAGLSCAAAACELVKGLGEFNLTWTPTVDGPSLGDARVEPTLEVFGKIEASIGNPFIASLQFDALEAKAGGKLAGNWAPQLVQILDPAYQSEFQLTVEGSVGAGHDLGEAAQLLGLGDIASQSLEFSKDVARSPTGTLSADHPAYATGDIATVAVHLEEANLSFLNLYDVDKVLLVRYSSGTQTQLASATATSGQKDFELTFTASAPIQSSELYAFIVTKLPPIELFALEVGRSSGPSKIAFQSGRDGNPEIYSMNPDGSGLVRLTTTDAVVQDVSPAWSPDRTRIAFNSTRGTGYFRLFVMNADGSGVTEVPVPAGGTGIPRWSPNGKQIAFANGAGTIVVLNADGSDAHTVGAGTSVSWSPDGSQLAVTRLVGGRLGYGGYHQVFTISADGSSAVQLTTSELDKALGSWSPDGAKILFYAVFGADGTDIGETGIYAVTVASRTAVRIVEGYTFGPDWSSDGTRVLYAGDCGGTKTFDICIVNADGTGTGVISSSPAADIGPDW